MKIIINFYIFKILAPSYTQQNNNFTRFLFRLSAAPYWYGRGGFQGRGGHNDRGGRGRGANGRRGGGNQGGLGGDQG